MCPTVKSFIAALRVIPARPWSANALKEGVDFPGLPTVSSRLEVNLSIANSLKGSFKTSHRGSISTDDELPRSLSGTVCVKQLYFTEAGRSGVMRYPGSEELSLILTEALCLDWAVILLDLTYAFIKDFESEHGDFLGNIPHLRFVEAAIAEGEIQKKLKYFLIEEWIDTSKAPFTKYINNGLPVSCVPPSAPTKVKNIAEFLCFAQHVQFQVTNGLVYTSDYQGMSINIVDFVLQLTEPRIRLTSHRPPDLD